MFTRLSHACPLTQLVCSRHPTFAGVVGEGPLPLGESSIAPFTQEDFALGMKQGHFCCGFNLFQLSLTYAPCPAVPINRKGA